METGIGEIKRQYKCAKDKKKCISILAELNCCSTDRIKDILGLCEKASTKAVEDERIALNAKEIKALYASPDELDAQIKPLEDEYKRTVRMLLSAESG